MTASRDRTDTPARIHHFETILDALWKPGVHHLHRMNHRAVCENLTNTRFFGGGTVSLSVRLISL
jgi:hypothetical protein